MSDTGGTPPSASARVPFLDLRVIDPAEKADLLHAVERVLDHGRIVLGPEVEAFEARVAEACGRRHAVGVNSGTHALIVGLKALGIGPGDEVITTPMSWIATANAVALAGATPVFADIGDDLNLDPASIEPLITDRTRAILPVHFTGRMCDMPEILKIAERHGLLVIEDCAQAFTAELDGRPAGSWGSLACFSMNAMKVLASVGEAGALGTDDDTLAENLRAWRYAGMVEREVSHFVGDNARLHTLQAAMLLERMKRLPAVLARRREIARLYDARLEGVVRIPPSDNRHSDVYYTYTIQTPARDALRAHLAEHGIETKIQHPILMPRQATMAKLGRGAFPNAERLVGEILSIPAHEKMADAQVGQVADAVREFFGGAHG